MPIAAGTERLFDTLRTRNALSYKVSTAWGNKSVIRSFGKVQQLEKHSGCINTVAWNPEGTRLVSGSDDRSVVVWSGFPMESIITVPTGHRNNVFCATFVPGASDTSLVTSAADGCVHLLNTESGQRDVLYESAINSYCFKHCHDPSSPSTSGLVTLSDGSVVRFDLRSRSGSEVINIRHDINLRQLSMGRFSSPPSGTAIAFNPISPTTFALGTSTKAVLLFDSRNMSSCVSKIVPEFTIRPPDHYPGETEAVSGFDWDDRNRLIVNYCRQSVVEIDTGLVASKGGEPVKYRVGESSEIPRQWIGRANHQTFLKEVALLGNGKYIATGGDCGSLYVWERFGAQKLILKKDADPYVLNCVVPHPFLPFIATAGIASVADLWSISSDKCDDFESSESESVPSVFVEREELTLPLASERLERSILLRAVGNEAFRRGDFITALNRYNELCTSLQFRCPDADVNRNRRDALEKALTNKAAALMSLSRWTEAIDACDEALDLNTGSLRALLRRGKCYMRLGDWDLALEDLERALTLAPEDTETLRLLTEVEDRSTTFRR